MCYNRHRLIRYPVSRLCQRISYIDNPFTRLTNTIPDRINKCSKITQKCFRPYCRKYRCHNRMPPQHTKHCIKSDNLCLILLFQSIPLILIPFFCLLGCSAVAVPTPFVEYRLFNRYLHFLLMRECIFLFPFSLPQFILTFLYCAVGSFLFLFLVLQQFFCLLQFVL